MIKLWDIKFPQFMSVFFKGIYLKNKIRGIYKIINRINGKIYIGQSININCRLYVHKCNVKNNIKHPLYDSIRKYGLENFEFIIIEEVISIHELDKKEQYWMDYYKSYNPEFGYNLSPTAGGSPFGFKHTEESKKKNSDSKKGKKHTEEHKINNSKSKLGHSVSDITRFKISKSKKGQPAWNKGVTVVEEKLKEMSVISKKLWDNPEYRNKMLDARKRSEEKRLATVESKKLADPNYAKNIIGKRIQTRIQNGNTKIYSLSKEKVAEFYLVKNFSIAKVAQMLDTNSTTLAKFLKLHNIKKRKLKADKVKSIITDEQLHNLCDSININV